MIDKNYSASAIRERMLKEITLDELIAVIENREIITDTLEDSARISYIRKHKKSIIKSILKISIDML